MQNQLFTAGAGHCYIPRTVIEARWHEGDVIRKLRLLAGWGLEELAEKAGVGVSVINLLELGVTKEAERPTLTKLAAAFGLSFVQLLEQVPSSPVRTNAPIVVRTRQRGGTTPGERRRAAQRKRAGSR